MSNIEFTKKDLEEVAKLSRLSLTEEEKEKFVVEMKAVLNYVAQVSEMVKQNTQMSGSEGYGQQFENSYNKNSLREDRALTEGNFYTEDILKNAPKREGNFIEVPQVLTKHKK